MAPDSSPPSPPLPKTHAFTVRGTATSPSGAAYHDVEIGFKDVTACAACPAVTAATDSAGRYSLALPAANYLAVCLSTPYICTIGRSNSNQLTLTVSMDTTIDITVNADDPPPITTEPGPTVSGPPASGYTLSGHVLTNEGKPVPGISIELVPPGTGGGSVSTTTETDGSYGINAGPMIYNVKCISPNPDYECGPVNGDGTDNPIDTADSGQTLEFILCRSEDSPRCLRS